MRGQGGFDGGRARGARDIGAQGGGGLDGQGREPGGQTLDVAVVEGLRDDAAAVLAGAVDDADLEPGVAGVDQDDDAHAVRTEISPTEMGTSPASVCTTSRPCASVPRPTP